MKTRTYLTAILAIVIMSFAACKKYSVPERNPFEVMMTDSPADYEMVNVQIEQVEAKVVKRDGTEEWVEVKTHAFIYNLLDYTNARMVKIAGDNIDGVEVKAIRFRLGDINNIVVDNRTVPLHMDENYQKSLTLNTDIDLERGKTANVTIDFNAAKSVIKTKEGQYLLKPHIEIKS